MLKTATRVLSSQILLTALLTAFSPAFAAQPSSSQPATDPVGAKLQAFLLDAKKRLGALEPWQEKLFTDEVLTENRRFIRDYRENAHGVQAEADLDSIRKYLRFYAPKSLKSDNPQLLVLLHAQTGCAKCAAAAPAIRAMVKGRLERRGLIPVWITPDALPNPLAAGRELDDEVSALATQKKAVGALVVQTGPAPVDDIDTAHADELHFLVQSSLNIQDVANEQQQLDLLDNGDLEHAEAKLLTDAFTDLGDKVAAIDAVASELNRTEILVEITGFEKYEDYAKARDQVREALKAQAAVEEQKVSRGRATLAVHTEQPVEKVQARLAALKAMPAGDSGAGAPKLLIELGK